MPGVQGHRTFSIFTSLSEASVVIVSKASNYVRMGRAGRGPTFEAAANFDTRTFWRMCVRPDGEAVWWWTPWVRLTVLTRAST